MKVAAIVPAYDAARTVAQVVAGLLPAFGHDGVLVVDDGSSDATAFEAQGAGAEVISLPRNRGKGAALRAGFEAALARGFDAAVTVDADGQHPPEEAARLRSVGPADALVLGIRDLDGAGAPKANRISNGISNFFLSMFAGRLLCDTQCGLRRYPLRATLDLGASDVGYAFEAEIILRAIAGHVPLFEVPVRVVYPPEEERLTHFDSVRDPARIVARVVTTLWRTRGLSRIERPRRDHDARP